MNVAKAELQPIAAFMFYQFSCFYANHG